MARRSVPASRPEKRTKKRVEARPPVPAESAVAVSAPTLMPGAVRPAWMTPARSSGRNTGLIRDEDYRYIFSDLRRIGVLAGAGFAALVILSFVLR